MALSEFAADVASVKPSPGGGAVGAVVLTLAIACGLKAIGISFRYRQDDPLLQTAENQLRPWALEAMELADADGEAFAALMTAYRLPRTNIEQAQLRSLSIREHAAVAADVGERLLRIGELAKAALLMAEPSIHLNIVNDYQAAIALLDANSRIQTDNVRANRSIERKYMQ